MACGPPLNLPRRQGRATVWARPQAPGSPSWDRRILTERQVVDARVAEQLLAALVKQRSHRRPRCFHHGFDVLALHLPGRGRRGDWTEDDDATSLAQPLVVAEHLMMQRELQRPGDELPKSRRRRL